MVPMASGHQCQVVLLWADKRLELLAPSEVRRHSLLAVPAPTTKYARK